MKPDTYFITQMNILFAFQISMCDKSRNTWLRVHWQWNTLEWCPLNALQASPVVHLVTPLSCVSLSMKTLPSVPAIVTTRLFDWSKEHDMLKARDVIVRCRRFLAAEIRGSYGQFIWLYILDSQVQWANMEPIWGRQDPGGAHVGPLNFAIWDAYRSLHRLPRPQANVISQLLSLFCIIYSSQCTIHFWLDMRPSPLPAYA